jgi:CRISPR system Cascade subunit CasC
VKNFALKDAADIAIFGRMVANDATLNIEAAGLFSHAISTHACDNDLDFWTAVDDERPKEEPGAANMGHAEFNAACYYRYAALNLDLLFYQKTTNGRPPATLSCFAGEEYKATRHAIVEAFLRATILAVPTAKHTGMNANLPPEYVFGVVATGQPMQLVNAFEAPVRANGEGWLKPSVEALKKHYERLKKTFELEPLICKGGEVWLSEETPLNLFISKLVAHVE